MNITLDDRLKSCAEFVRNGAVLADVGTDHAYLPAFLMKQGKIKSAIACDINEKPLESAKATIFQYDVNSIELRLCDGLSGVSKNEFSDLVIAGMGGELIIKILESCPYIKSGEYNIILQPMSKAYDLRKWLYKNGFSILDEKAAVSNDKIYTVMNVKYDNSNKEESEAFYHFGKLLLKDDEKSKKYVLKIKNSLEKRAKGILSADKDNSEASDLLKICENIKI